MSEVPVTQKDWVSKLHMTPEEQVFKTRLTQLGLGFRAHKGEVIGKKAISKGSAQVANLMAETFR